MDESEINSDRAQPQYIAFESAAQLVLSLMPITSSMVDARRRLTRLCEDKTLFARDTRTKLEVLLPTVILHPSTAFPDVEIEAQSFRRYLLRWAANRELPISIGSILRFLNGEAGLNEILEHGSTSHSDALSVNTGMHSSAGAHNAPPPPGDTKIINKSKRKTGSPGKYFKPEIAFKASYRLLLGVADAEMAKKHIRKLLIQGGNGADPDWNLEESTIGDWAEEFMRWYNEEVEIEGGEPD